MEHQQSSTPHASTGFTAGVVGVAKNMFGLLVSRIELAALELAEVRTNFLQLLLAFALGIMAVWFAIAYWTALVVFLTWDTLGWKILLIIAVAFTLLAIGILLYAQSLFDQGKLSMSATINELRNDRDMLL